MALSEDQIQMLLRRERAGGLTPEQASDIAAMREAGRFPEALPGGGGEAQPPPRPDPRELLGRAALGGAFKAAAGTEASVSPTPQAAVERSALIARVAPGLIPNPWASSAASMGGEVVAQAAEQGIGVREGFSETDIALAGATPLLVAGIIRGMRAAGRTAVRAVPSLFHKAQGQAFSAADDVSRLLTPEADAGQLFRSVRGASAQAKAPTPARPIAALPAIGETSPTAYGPTGRFVAGELTEREGVRRTLEAAGAAARGEGYREGAGMLVTPEAPGASFTGQIMRLVERQVPPAPTSSAIKEAVPASRITAILDDLDQAIPAEPTNAALQQVRTFMTKLRGAVRGGGIDLDELMRQRLDLGREIARSGSAPELRAIYGHGGDGAKGIIGALEEAAEKGGAGASMAREALDIFKRDLGVVRWKELVDQATRRTSVSGVDTPALNVAKLGDLVMKNSQELKGLLGAEGLDTLTAFLTRFRSLPPTHAATAANLLVSAGLGGVGALAGVGSGAPILGTAIGLIGKEAIQNAWAVGRNPAAVNMLMTGLAQAARAAAGQSIQVGPAAQEAARGGR